MPFERTPDTQDFRLISHLFQPLSLHPKFESMVHGPCSMVHDPCPLALPPFWFGLEGVRNCIRGRLGWSRGFCSICVRDLVLFVQVWHFELVQADPEHYKG